MEGLKRYRRNKAGPAPMTEVEQEIQNATAIKNFNDTSNQSLKGVAFPIDHEAAEKLRQLREGLINYVQLVMIKVFCLFNSSTVSLFSPLIY